VAALSVLTPWARSDEASRVKCDKTTEDPCGSCPTKQDQRDTESSHRERTGFGDYFTKLGWS
jgi:hypothetical protein